MKPQSKKPSAVVLDGVFKFATHRFNNDDGSAMILARLESGETTDSTAPACGCHDYDLTN